MPQNGSDVVLYWLINVAVVLLIVALLVGLSTLFNGFSKELKYLNCEIRRTRGSERRYYKRRRRRLWWSTIFPFIRY